MFFEVGVLLLDFFFFLYYYIILFEFLKLFVNYCIVVYIVFKNMNDFILKFDKLFKKFKDIYFK